MHSSHLSGGYPHYPSFHGYGSYQGGFPGYGEPRHVGHHHAGGLFEMYQRGAEMAVPSLGAYRSLQRGSSSDGSRGAAPDRGRSSTDWSLAAKVALVAGGALAVYLIYHASKFSSSMGEKVGEGATKLLEARYTGGGSLGKESPRLGSSERGSNLFSGERARPQLPPRRETIVDAVPVYESYSRS